MLEDSALDQGDRAVVFLPTMRVWGDTVVRNMTEEG